ncbi:MAG TPA: ATP-binding protein [Elusimicrobiota bacterium]|nr:ATP-binding protein [Elusimicrobiota bacterium]
MLPRLMIERSYKLIFERLEQTIKAQEVILDASDVLWISPLGTILLADFTHRRQELGLTTSIIMPKQAMSNQYIRDSGLFNLTQSSNLDGAITSSNVQLRLLNRMDGNVPELLVNFACGQAEDVDDDDRALLRVWVTELMTNANDHAKSEKGFWVCARYNPNRNPKLNNMNICVADSGIGIKESLLRSGKYGKEMSHSQAIEKALEEGVTSRAGHTGGLGLKHIVAYVKSHGGSLTIFSGNACVRVRRKRKKEVKTIPQYQGTIVTAAFNIRTVSKYSKSEGSAESPFQFQ